MALTTAELQILITAKDMASRELEQLEGKSKSAFGAIEKGSLVATGAMALLAGAAVKAAADYEFAMDAVQAVSGATNAEMAKMSDLAKQIGADTAFSASQAAGAMEELAANGVSVNDILGGAAEAAADLAAAGGIDLPRAADIASTAMAVWNLKTSDMTDVVNRLVGAADVGRFSVEDMGRAIAQGGGAAAVAGVDFKDFAVAIAATSENFASGSDAATSYKTFITSLSGNSKEAKEEIKALGLEFFDAQGNIKSTAEIAGELERAFKGMSDEQVIATGKLIFGNDAVRTMAGLMKDGEASVAALYATMGNTDASEKAAIRMGNMKGSVEELKGSLETLGISLGQQAIPALTTFADIATQAVNWFGGLPETTQNTALSMTALAVAAPATAAGIMKVVDAIKEINSAGAMGSVAVKLGALGLGIAAVDVAVSAVTGKGVVERFLDSFKGYDEVEAVTKALKEFNEEKERAGMGGDPERQAADAVAELNAAHQELNETLREANRSLFDFASVKDAYTGTTTEVQALTREYIEMGESGNKSGKLVTEAQQEMAEAAHVAGIKMVEAGASAIDILNQYYALASNPPAQNSFGDAVEINKILYESAQLSRQYSEAIAAASASNSDWAATAAVAAAAAEAATGPFTGWTAALGKGADVAARFNEQVGLMAGAMATLDPVYANNALQIITLNEALSDLDQTGADFHAGLGMTRGELEAALVPLEAYNGAVDSNSAATKDWLTTMDAFAPVLGLTKDEILNMAAAADAGTTSSEDMTDVLGTLSTAFGLLATDDIPGAVEQFKILTTTAPEVAAAVGDLFIKKLRAGITDEAQWADMRGHILGAGGLDIGAFSTPLAAEAGTTYANTLTANASDAATLGQVQGLVLPYFNFDLSESGRSVGGSFGDGIVAGIGSRLDAVVASAVSIVSAAVAAAAGPRGIDRGSPSRKTRELGHDFVAGLAVGIDEDAHKAVTEAVNMAAATVEGAQDALEDNWLANKGAKGLALTDKDRIVQNWLADRDAKGMVTGRDILEAATPTAQAVAGGYTSWTSKPGWADANLGTGGGIAALVGLINNMDDASRHMWMEDPKNAAMVASFVAAGYKVAEDNSIYTPAQVAAGFQNPPAGMWFGKTAEEISTMVGLLNSMDPESRAMWLADPRNGQWAQAINASHARGESGIYVPRGSWQNDMPGGSNTPTGGQTPGGGNIGTPAYPDGGLTPAPGTTHTQYVGNDGVKWVLDENGNWTLTTDREQAAPNHKVPIVWEEEYQNGRKTKEQWIEMGMLPPDAAVQKVDPDGTVHWISPTLGEGKTANAVGWEYVGHGAVVENNPYWGQADLLRDPNRGVGGDLWDQMQFASNNYSHARGIGGLSDAEVGSMFHLDAYGNPFASKFSGMSMANLLRQGKGLKDMGTNVGDVWRAQYLRELMRQQGVPVSKQREYFKNPDQFFKDYPAAAGSPMSFDDMRLARAASRNGESNIPRGSVFSSMLAGGGMAGVGALIGGGYVPPWGSYNDQYGNATPFNSPAGGGSGGRSVVVNVNTMDSRSFIDNADLIRDAVRYGDSRRVGM